MMLLANIIQDAKNVIFLLLELRLKSLDQIANSPKLLNIGQIANFLWMTMRNLDLSELLYRPALGSTDENKKKRIVYF